MLLLYVVGLVIGLAFLWWSGDKAITSSQAIAAVYHLDTFFIGFVLLAVSTALPEFAIAINAIIKDVPALSVSDIVGSNFYNISAILGIPTSIIGPLIIETRALKNTLIMVLINCALMGILFSMATLSRLIGSLLIVCYIGSIIYIWYTQRTIDIDNALNGEVEALSTPHTSPWWLFTRFFLSVAGILLASKLCVDTALIIVAATPLTLEVVGATIIALGTSLPELALSIIAIRKKDYALALGNALGAVLKQATLVLGVLTIFSRTTIHLTHIRWIAPFFYAAMGIITIGIILRKKIGRIEGFMLLMLTLMFIFYGYARINGA